MPMNSLMKYLQSIQLRLYKASKEYKKRDLPIDMAQILADASSMLICLPQQLNEIEMSSRFIEQIHTNFPKARITVLSENGLASGGAGKSFHSVTFTEDDLSRYQKPRKSFLNQHMTSFDVAIDLSITYSFPNVVFMWQSNARLRIGFYHPDRDALYNFLLRHKENAPPEHSYQALVNYLNSFH